MKRVFIVLLSAMAVQAVAQTECTKLGEVMGLQILKSSGSFDSMSVQSYQFCSYEYNAASKSDQAQIEASYKVLTGNASKSSQEIITKQAGVCKGFFGMEYVRSLSSAESVSASKNGSEVVTACLQQNTVRITDVSYDYPSLRFNVRNGTDREVKVRGIVPSTSSLVASCKPLNLSSSLFGAPTLKPGNSVEVLCDLAPRESTDKGAPVQYGGGFIHLDIPDSNSRSLPVPVGYAPDLARRLEAELAALRLSSKEFTGKITQLNGDLQASRAETQKARDAERNLESGTLSRLHVFLNCVPKFQGLPGNDRFHYLEEVSPGSCAPNWGPLAEDFAKRACGADNYYWKALQNVPGGAGGYTVGAIVCKGKQP